MVGVAQFHKKLKGGEFASYVWGYKVISEMKTTAGENFRKIAEITTGLRILHAFNC